jgi:hypothetical protein
MKNLIIIAALFFIASTGYAQIDTIDYYKAKQKWGQYIGIGAGASSGLGFSYKYMPNKYGVMVTVLPYLDRANDEALITGGLTFEKVLSRCRTNFLFMYFANSIWYNKQKNWDYSYDPYNGFYDPDYYTIEETLNWNSGIGLGIEFHSQKRVVFNFMLGYGSYWDVKNTMSLERLFFTAEGFVFYRFR